MKIAIFGLGYVGAVTAAGLASQGHNVYGVDVDEHKVGQLLAGISPVVEPGLDDLVKDGIASGRLNATTDPAVALDQADVSLLCVGTPSKAQGGTDLTYLRARAGGHHAGHGRGPAAGFGLPRRGRPQHRAAGHR